MLEALSHLLGAAEEQWRRLASTDSVAFTFQGNFLITAVYQSDSASTCTTRAESMVSTFLIAPIWCYWTLRIRPLGCLLQVLFADALAGKKEHKRALSYYRQAIQLWKLSSSTGELLAIHLMLQ